jgi:excisionase family DNA binding protein
MSSQIEISGEQSPAITLCEAAMLMASTVHHVRTLVWSGQLSFQRAGKRFVVPRDEVLELIDAGWRRNGEVRIESKVKAK